MKRLLLGLVLMLAVAQPSAAARREATPASFKAVWAAARPGDTIVLGRGLYAGVDLRAKTFSPRLTVDARAATLERWILKNVGGLNLVGGDWRLGCLTSPCPNRALVMYDPSNITISEATFTGPLDDRPEAPVRADGVGILILGGSQLEVLASTFVGFKLGVGFGKVTDFKAIGNRFLRMRSDGIDIANSWNGLIEKNVCEGTKITGEEHPDCVQMWSKADTKPTSDIVIRRNVASGGTQGFTGFNGAPTYPAGYKLWSGEILKEPTKVDNGGFDRILIEDNDVTGGHPQGIALYDGRDSIVRNNRVRTVPGSKYITNIAVRGDVKRCGNVREAYAGRPAVKDPPCR